MVELLALPPKKKQKKTKSKSAKPKKTRFEVRKVVKRNTDEFLGFFTKELGRTLVYTENSRIPIPFKVMGDTKNAQEQDKLLAKFVRWDPPARIPTCKIIKVLGPGGDARTDHKGILAKYGLSQVFPSKVEEEAKVFGQSISDKDCKGRKDLRKIFTLTIDPLDARDFDDALSLKILPDGSLEVGVHIADVSYYVKRGTALDNEAKKRSNSTYLVGEVVPMLPHSLSSGICSLVEGQDRLVKSVLFRFSPNARLKQHVRKDGHLLKLTFRQSL